MSRRAGLIPLEEARNIYARPGGGHYHLTKECFMLLGGDFERLLYEEIAVSAVKERKLSPCACAYVDAIRR